MPITGNQYLPNGSLAIVPRGLTASWHDDHLHVHGTGQNANKYLAIIDFTEVKGSNAPYRTLRRDSDIGKFNIETSEPSKNQSINLRGGLKEVTDHVSVIPRNMIIYDETILKNESHNSPETWSMAWKGWKGGGEFETRVTVNSSPAKLASDLGGEKTQHYASALRLNNDSVTNVVDFTENRVSPLSIKEAERKIWQDGMSHETVIDLSKEGSSPIVNPLDIAHLRQLDHQTNNSKQKSII